MFPKRNPYFNRRQQARMFIYAIASTVDNLVILFTLAYFSSGFGMEVLCNERLDDWVNNN